MPKLSARTSHARILKLSPGETASDGEGLRFKGLKSGAASIQFKYRHPISGNSNTITLGKYLEPLDLDGARDKARECRILLKQGLDPQYHSADRTAATFKEVGVAYLDTLELTEKSRRDRQQRSERYLFSTLGSVPMRELKPADVAVLLRSVQATGKFDLADRLAMFTMKVSQFAAAAGYTSADPFTGLKMLLKKKPQSTNREAVAPDELPELLNLIFTGTITPESRDCLMLQWLTMLRPGEIVRLEWAFIDWEKSCINIDARVMKAKRDHAVPLSTAALKILRRRQDLSTVSDYVFPSSSGAKDPHRNPESNHRALNRLGLQGRQTAHGFRALAITILQEKDFDAGLLDRCLAHVAARDADTTASWHAYARSTRLEERREVMQALADHTAGAITEAMS
jgi:integrase